MGRPRGSHCQYQAQQASGICRRQALQRYPVSGLAGRGEGQGTKVTKCVLVDIRERLLSMNGSSISHPSAGPPIMTLARGVGFHTGNGGRLVGTNCSRWPPITEHRFGFWNEKSVGSWLVGLESGSSATQRCAVMSGCLTDTCWGEGRRGSGSFSAGLLRSAIGRPVGGPSDMSLGPTQAPLHRRGSRVLRPHSRCFTPQRHAALEYGGYGRRGWRLCLTLTRRLLAPFRHHQPVWWWHWMWERT